jgi:aspartyl/glutamyl-tRNA(Asn/Gln) amidotransferase C subunit
LATTTTNVPAVTAKQLDHLSSLAKLVPFAERSTAEQQRLLKDVQSMLQHVETIQEVDTTAVVPLISLLEDEPLYRRADQPVECDIEVLKREAGSRMRGAFFATHREK